jgi:segregation and condensation protein A
MEEKVPWWRWALAFALGGIRSGFGLLRWNGEAETNAESGAAGVGAEPESGLEPENSRESENSPELENGAVESGAESTAENEDAESEIVPSGPKESAEDEPAELGAPEEDIALTKTSPQSEKAAVDVKQAASVPIAGQTPAASLAAPAREARPADEPVSARTTKAELAPAAKAMIEPTRAPDSAPPPARLPDPARAVQTTPKQEAETAPESTTTPQAAPAQKPAPTLPFDAKPAPEPTTAEKVAAALKARGEDAEQSPFSVIVSQVYDGPLDLLLDLIRRQDIDIYDIPIAQITAQFLAYVDRLRASDMDVAGEFIYTAALLIHIKSKMLLPRAPMGPEESAEDPRRELVDRLLEHERFRNAAQMLHEKQMLEAASWTNPGAREFREDESAEPEIAADTTDLVRIFRDILERARNRPILDVEEDAVTVSQMMQFLARRLTMEDKPVALRRMLSHTRSERALIALFLALLEMVRLQAILLRQDRHFSEIFIKKHTGFEAAMNQGLANARDDWR